MSGRYAGRQAGRQAKSLPNDILLVILNQKNTKFKNTVYQKKYLLHNKKILQIAKKLYTKKIFQLISSKRHSAVLRINLRISEMPLNVAPDTLQFGKFPVAPVTQIVAQEILARCIWIHDDVEKIFAFHCNFHFEFFCKTKLIFRKQNCIFPIQNNSSVSLSLSLSLSPFCI